MADKKNSPKKHDKNMKYHSETGNIALARNKCEDMLLHRNLEFYDKQSSKAVKSMEFARQQFLKTLSCKGNSKYNEEEVLRRFSDDKRRQSSPVVFSFATRNASIVKGQSVMHDTGLVSTEDEKSSSKLNRLYQHRHSLPIDRHNSLRIFQSSRARKEASLSYQTEDSANESFRTKARSWNDLKTLSDSGNKDVRPLKLHSSSLPKLYDITTGRKDKGTSSAIDKKQLHQQRTCFFSLEENQDNKAVSCECLPSISEGKHQKKVQKRTNIGPCVFSDSHLNSSSCPNLRDVAKANSSEANGTRREWSSSATECKLDLSCQERRLFERVSDTLPIILVSRPDSQMTLPIDNDV